MTEEQKIDNVDDLSRFLDELEKEKKRMTIFDIAMKKAMEQKKAQNPDIIDLARDNVRNDKVKAERGYITPKQEDRAKEQEKQIILNSISRYEQQIDCFRVEIAKAQAEVNKLKQRLKER